MNLILITAKGRHIPKPGDNSGFEVLKTQVKGNAIFKKQCGDYLVYVTKCIPDAEEGQPQLDKHNYIAAIVDVVESNAGAGEIDASGKYLIAHDGDLLEKNGRDWHRNGIYYEEEFKKVVLYNGVKNDPLSNRFEDKHIYIFQHEPIYKMFKKVISVIKNNFSVEQILAALDIIKKNEA